LLNKMTIELKCPKCEKKSAILYNQKRIEFALCGHIINMTPTLRNKIIKQQK